MPNIEPEEQEDKPLDPAMETVRRKMMKLQLVSGGIMFVMFIAVLTAIAYKLMQPTGNEQPAVAASGLSIPADQPIVAAALLPQGFTVISTDLSGQQILFYGTTSDGTRKALVFDLTVGRIVADVTVAGN